MMLDLYKNAPVSHFSMDVMLLCKDVVVPLFKDMGKAFLKT